MKLNIIQLNEVLSESPYERNSFIINIQQGKTKNEFNLVNSETKGILADEELQIALGASNIEILEGNTELSILKQFSCYYKVMNRFDEELNQYLDFRTLEKLEYKKQEEKYPYIEIVNEGVTYACEKDLDDVVECIFEEYHRHDVSMWDLIEFIEIHGLTVAETIKVYARLFYKSDGDTVLRYTGEEKKFDNDYIDLKE